MNTTLLATVRAGLLLVALIAALCCFGPQRLEASPGLCVGPVCADQFSPSSVYPWQLRLRVSDQQGRHERLLIDCRNGVVSPLQGPVERGYAAAVAKRACRLDQAVLQRGLP